MLSHYVVPCDTTPLGSLFWWLFLHRRLRFRQRGLGLLLSDIAPFSLIFSKELCMFLSMQFRFHSRSTPAKPFGFDSRRISNSIRSPCFRNDVSPHHFLFLVPVKMPVSNSDCVMNFMPSRASCQVENTLTIALILRALVEKLVENFPGKVSTIVNNFASL